MAIERFTQPSRSHALEGYVAIRVPLLPMHPPALMDHTWEGFVAIRVPLLPMHPPALMDHARERFVAIQAPLSPMHPPALMDHAWKEFVAIRVPLIPMHPPALMDHRHTPLGVVSARPSGGRTTPSKDHSLNKCEATPRYFVRPLKEGRNEA